MGNILESGKYFRKWVILLFLKLFSEQLWKKISGNSSVFETCVQANLFPSRQNDEYHNWKFQSKVMIKKLPKVDEISTIQKSA